MSITRNRPIFVFVTTMVGVFLLSSTGCVSSSKYEMAKREAEQTQRELQKERQKILEGEKVHAERKRLVEEWLGRLGQEVKRLNVIATSCGDLQNELTLLRLSRELGQGKPNSISVVIEKQPSIPEAAPSVESQPGSIP